MIAKIVLTAFAAVAVAGGALAQPQPAAEPQRRATTVGDTLQFFRWSPQENYARYCNAGYPSVSLEKSRIERVVVLPDDGGPLVSVACVDSRKLGVALAVDSIGVALTFLAYKPFAPFWPEAEARWGADLSVLRQDLRERALQAVDYGLTPGLSVREETATARARASGLAQLGYFDESRAIYSARLAELLAAKAAGEQVDFDLVSMAITQAASIRYDAGPDASADFLADFAAAVPVGPGHAINLAINRAAYLAEADRHAEALALLTPTYMAYKEGVSDGGFKISGSDREFAWIFACSYSHMGENRALRRYEAIVTEANERPRDQYLLMTKATTDIKQRMYRCMNNPAGYFATWRQGDEPILSSDWLEFQQRGERPQTGVPRGWGALAEAQMFAKDYRQLPDGYLPALRLWRDRDVAVP
jgi:hypothetical protein